MSDRPRPDARQLRASLLPNLMYVAVLPYVIYRLASPYMPAAYALLLAGVPPAIRIILGLIRYRRLNLLGVFSLIAIAMSIFSALVLKDTRLQFMSDGAV